MRKAPARLAAAAAWATPAAAAQPPAPQPDVPASGFRGTDYDGQPAGARIEIGFQWKLVK